MAKALRDRKCEPCHGGTPRIEGSAIGEYTEELDERWGVEEEHHLIAEFTFSDFMEALEFTNRVGQLAEEEGHHPEITVTWGRVSVKIWTHAIDGLSESDFILAAKIDALPS